METVLQTSGFTLQEADEENPVTKRITDSLEVAGIGQPGKGRYKVENLVTSRRDGRDPHGNAGSSRRDPPSQPTST